MTVSIYKMMKHLCARYRMRPYSRACCPILQFPALNTKSHAAPPHFLHSFSDSDGNGAKVEQLEPSLVPAVRFCPPKLEPH